MSAFRYGTWETIGLATLPILALGFSAFGALVAGRPRASLAARVYGGPTEGVQQLSLRVEAFAQDGIAQTPLRGRALVVEADGGGRKVLSRPQRLDEEGSTALDLPLPGSAVVGAPRTGKLMLRIHADGETIAEGSVELSRAAWIRASRRHGGWGDWAEGAGIAMRAAAGRGAFAVPFEDPLLVEVRSGAGPAVGVTVVAVAQGASVRPPSAETDARGRARFFVTPTEHTPSFLLRATTANGTGTLEFGLPVTPGALHAERASGEIIVRSPVARPRAYVALVTETARVGGATVELSPDPRGGAVGSFPAPQLDGTPLWAVVSSEPDLRSAAVVGWPLVGPEEPEPQTTFDAVDALLLDTSRLSMDREHRRAKRARIKYAIGAVVALALDGIVAVNRARRSGALRSAVRARAAKGEGLPTTSALGPLLTLLSVLLLAAVMLAAFTLLAGMP